MRTASKRFQNDESWYSLNDVKTPKLRLNSFTGNYKVELDLGATDELISKRTESTGRDFTYSAYKL